MRVGKFYPTVLPQDNWSQSPLNGYLLCQHTQHMREQTDQRSLLFHRTAACPCSPAWHQPSILIPTSIGLPETKTYELFKPGIFKHFRNKFSCADQKGTVHARWCTGLLPHYSRRTALKRTESFQRYHKGSSPFTALRLPLMPSLCCRFCAFLNSFRDK